MKKLLGIILILGGITFGLWLGLWVMFIGGIIGLVNAFKSTPIEAMSVAINIVKILFASFIGSIAGYCLVIPGISLLND